MDRQTLTIIKACEAVDVSRRTIYNWIKSGKVEFVRTAGGSVRIYADSLWQKPDPQAHSADHGDRPDESHREDFRHNESASAAGRLA